LSEGVGTILYCARERILSEDHGKRSDLWSLGVIFYEILSKQKPFSSKLEIINRQLYLDTAPKKAIGLPDWVPEHIQVFILKLLSKEKVDRPRMTNVKAEVPFANNSKY